MMLTSLAATTAPQVTDTLAAVIVIYLVLTVATIAVLVLMARRWQQEGALDEGEAPYGPRAGQDVEVSSS